PCRSLVVLSPWVFRAEEVIPHTPLRATPEDQAEEQPDQRPDPDADPFVEVSVKRSRCPQEGEACGEHGQAEGQPDAALDPPPHGRPLPVSRRAVRLRFRPSPWRCMLRMGDGKALAELRLWAST